MRNAESGGRCAPSFVVRASARIFLPRKTRVGASTTNIPIQHSSFPSAHPLVRRGTPVLFRPPVVWLRKFWAPPPKGRLAFFWPPVGTKRLPSAWPAGLLRPCFSCLKFAL